MHYLKKEHMFRSKKQAADNIIIQIEIFLKIDSNSHS